MPNHRPRTVTHHLDHCLFPGLPGCVPVRMTGTPDAPVREICLRCVWLEDQDDVVEVDAGMAEYNWLDEQLEFAGQANRSSG